jgi:hypothetical protein
VSLARILIFEREKIAVEIPHLSKQRLGLDDERCWVMLTEANRFVWPGPDIGMRESGDPASVAYGLLPRSLAKEIIRRFGGCIPKIEPIGKLSETTINRGSARNPLNTLYLAVAMSCHSAGAVDGSTRRLPDTRLYRADELVRELTRAADE